MYGHPSVHEEQRAEDVGKSLGGQRRPAVGSVVEPEGKTKTVLGSSSTMVARRAKFIYVPRTHAQILLFICFQPSLFGSFFLSSVMLC